MSVSPSDILVIAPEFATLTSTVIQTFINAAGLSVNSEAWGEKTDLGVSYLTAHRLTISFPGGSATGGDPTTGTIKSEKVGDLARTYGESSSPSTGSTGEKMLASTKYGQIFLTLQDEVPAGPMVITPGLIQSGILT